jgi:hypothetical protein
VEPESGVIIRGQEQPNRRFVYNGTEVPTTVGTIGYTPETVAANVREYKDKAASLKMLRSTGPVALGVIGALLLIGGVLLLVRGSRRDDDDSQLRRRHRAPVDSQA